MYHRRHAGRFDRDPGVTPLFAAVDRGAAMIKGHGGNIFDIARGIGCNPCDIIDMSSNMNPLGPPNHLLDHLKRSMDIVHFLPEVDAAGAVRAFAAGWNLDPSQVLAANGTTQFIYSLPLSLESKKVLIAGPTYADYADACRMHHVPFDFILSRPADAFRLDFAELERSMHGVDTVVICNPNNPTGVLIPSGNLAAFIDAHPEVRFIIDESYLPFADDAVAESLIPKALSNVLVLYSMSKIFRIPGLRIGFLIGSQDLIRHQDRYSLPWSVNSMSQAAVSYLMNAKREIASFIDETRKFLTYEKAIVYEAFNGVPQISLHRSTTSFILARLGEPYTAEPICGALLEKKILIRNCANFAGLSNRFIRFSLKTHDVNQLMIQSLLDVFRDA
jgi:threonine-phosphate decarboxylase